MCSTEAKLIKERASWQGEDELLYYFLLSLFPAGEKLVGSEVNVPRSAVLRPSRV